MSISAVHEISGTVQAAAAVAGQSASQGTMEFPNFITVLEHLFPQSPFVRFLAHWETVVFSFLVLGFIAFRSIQAARKKDWIPQGLQNRWEFIAEGMTEFITSILGPKGIDHVPFLGTLFIYILIQNWLGLLPFMKSPTSVWSTTIALALVTTLYIQWAGIKAQGFLGYLKHMAGDPRGLMGFCMIPLMFAINLIVEYLALPFSLSLRLFANISNEDKLLYQLAEFSVLYKGLFFPFQLFVNILAIIFGFIQAFVFLLLPTIYIALLMPHEEPSQESLDLKSNKPVSNH